MALVTLRSLPEWAAFLAGEEIGTVKEIWAEIVAAVVQEKLPAITHKPVPNFHIPGIVRLIVLQGRPVSRYIWNPQDFLPFLKETIVDDAVFAELNQQLDPVLIRSVDMDGWLRDCSPTMPANEDDIVSVSPPALKKVKRRGKKTAAFLDWRDEKYPNGTPLGPKALKYQYVKDTQNAISYSQVRASLKNS